MLSQTDLDILDPQERLEFERLLQWLRLTFLLAPPLVLIAFGRPALSYATLIGVAAGASYIWMGLLARFCPNFLLRFQLGARLLDCLLVFLVLTEYHAFLHDAYYDSVYLLFVVAAAATHGRRGAWILSVVAGVAVLASRLELMATGRLAFEVRHLTDPLFYTIFFATTSTAVAFLMRKSAEVVRRREQAWRTEIAARNAELERTAAQLDEALKLRDAMLTSVSHDLRAPLTVVKAQAQLARRRLAGLESPAGERLMVGIGHIEAAATRMTRWIDELLDLARARGGAAPDLERESVDLVALARQAIAEHQATTDNHEIVLEHDHDQLVGQWDRARLERVLDNLLGNALKYSPRGGRITVRLGQADGWVRLVVSDQGVGIPAEDLPRIFQPFARASNVVGQFTGTGIGLTATSLIVESHGGAIDAESTPDVGTTVTVRLPLSPTLLPS